MIFGAVQVGQVIDDGEVEHRSHEHAEQVLQAAQHCIAQRPLVGVEGEHQHQQVQRQP